MIGRSACSSDSTHMEVRSPNTDIEFEAYYELRWRVLRKPWGEARGTEYDEHDEKAIHIAAFNDSKNLVGVGRLQLVEKKLGQVRYMAVEPDFRKQGVGQLILLQLEKQAREQGMTAIVLDAREHAVGFYIRNGYKITGSSYLLFGEIPHSKMEKQIEGSA